jgi:hypothetical protein
MLKVAFVRVSRTTTSAAGTDAPEESDTVPTTEADSLWANAPIDPARRTATPIAFLAATMATPQPAYAANWE